MKNLTQFNVESKNNYYYYKGHKVPLTISNDKVLVGFKSPKSKDETMHFLTNIENSTLHDKERTLNNLMTGDSHSYTILYLDSTSNQFSSINEVDNSLSKSESVAYLSPFFKISAVDKTEVSLLNRVILKLLNAEQIELHDSLFQNLEVDSIIPMESNDYTYLLTLNENNQLSALDVANSLFETGKFEFATPDFLRIAFSNSFTPNDQHYPDEWHIPQIAANEAWCWSTGSNVKVAICDVGINTAHPDLSPNYIQTYDPTGQPLGYDTHGTECAGCAVAKGNNQIGVAGVAFSGGFYSIRIGYKSNSDPNDPSFVGQDSWLINGIHAAWYNYNVDILSCSFSWGAGSSAVDNAFNSALGSGRNNKGCCVFVATGNSNATSIAYPANIANVFAIGSSSHFDTRSSFSNYGTGLAFVAPGVDIYTTEVTGGYFQNFSGTSAATPVSAGIAALMLSLNPNLLRSDVYRIMIQSCDKIGGYTYSAAPYGTYNNEMGYGRINAFLAINNVLQGVFSISGPNYLCVGSQGTFSVSNLPTGSVALWSAGSGVSIDANSGVATAQSAGEGQRIAINVQISNSCSTTNINTSKTLPVGAVQAECFGNANISSPYQNSWAAAYNGSFYLKNNNNQTGAYNYIYFGYAPSIGQTTSYPPASGTIWGTQGITAISIVSQPSGWTGTYISGNSLSVYCNNASGVLGINLQTPCGWVFCRFSINGI